MSYLYVIKRFILCTALFGISIHSYARTVISTEIREPIAYASVGVVNKTFGTVCDSCGNFTLDTSGFDSHDTILISCVGYLPRKASIEEFNVMQDSVSLNESVVSLKEVTVKPQKIKRRTAGRKGDGGFIYIYIEGDRASGQGVAIPLKVKGKAWLKEFGFSIIENEQTLSFMKFRINIYGKEDGEYILENIPSVYFDFYKSSLSNGHFTYKLPDEIMLEKGEYYIELEFLQNFRNEHFTMRSKPLTGQTRCRYASQSQWETLPFGAPIWIDYDCAE